MAFRFRARAWVYGLACACALLCGWRTFAHAQSDDDARARAHFVAGETYFADGRFADAAREFNEAYQLSGRPEMLINLSRAYERAGDVTNAVEALEVLLERYPRTSYRADAEAQLALLRERTPAPAPELASPAPPSPASAAQTLDAGEARRPAWPPAWPVLSVASVTLASALVAVGTGWAAHHKYKALDGACPEGSCTGSGFEGDRDAGQRLSRTSTGFTFAAIALSGVTAALWVLDAKGRIRLSAAAAPSMAQARLHIAF